MATPRRSTFFILIYVLVLAEAATALEAKLQSSSGGAGRLKRQTDAGQRLQSSPSANNKLEPVATASAQGSAQVSVTSLGSASADDDRFGSSNTRLAAANQPRRPKVPEKDVDIETTLEDDERPVARRRGPKKVRPTGRRTPVVRDQDELDGAEDDYEDCHDEDYDYGRAFHEAATRPMRHFGRMMEGMFGRMRGLAAGEFHRIPGGSAAVASSSSGGDGYSRMESVVSSNGRTRGIVTETRNGRTTTRHIGSDDDEEEYR